MADNGYLFFSEVLEAACQCCTQGINDATGLNLLPKRNIRIKLPCSSVVTTTMSKKKLTNPVL